MTPDSVVLLAGFVLAHGAWSASDLPKGELLVPLAVVETGGQRQLLRFEAQTQEQSIAEGKATLAKRQTLLANAPSVALATWLGYQPYATHLAVRLTSAGAAA